MALASPGAPSTMRNWGRRSSRLMRSSRTVRQAPVLSPPMLLIASTTFWPSSRTPMTTRSEIEVALRSSRTRVPSRMSRTIGSSANERVFHASQSFFTLRQVRLTVSLPTAPPNRAASARRTRRVLVPSQIGARDQRVGGQRAALISPQRLALPLRRLALRGVQSGARHRDLDRPEGPGQRPRPAPVAVARNACSSFIAGHLASTVTRAGKHSVELAADHLFDELTRPSAHLGLANQLSKRSTVISTAGC